MTRKNVGACGLALGLVISGWAVASENTPSPFAPPAEPGIKQEAPGREDKPPAPRKVVATSPKATDVVITQSYLGQIRARRHIEVRTMSAGYLEAIPVREGQAVKRGDVLFQIAPILHKARLQAELAKVKVAEIKLENAKQLLDQKVVNQKEVDLYAAELGSARTAMKLAEAELNSATVKAPFDGLIGRFWTQEGSLISDKDVLTTLSDNSVMWVYFNVPEARYLEYQRRQGQGKDPSRLELADSRIELALAGDRAFAHDAGSTVTVENKFNSETGNIALRADFPNPDRLLRHGQIATVLIRRTLKNVTVIPQRATFEVLDKRYVYVIGKDDVARRREIAVEHEVNDIFVIKTGLDVTDKIVLEGVRQISDGDKVEYEFRKP